MRPSKRPVKSLEHPICQATQQAALDDFAKWSNYMLVTTVAVAAWGAGADGNVDRWTKWALCFLVLSAVAGILTLALVPLVRQRISDDTTSIYEIRAKPQFWCSAVSLQNVCVWQHGFLILGLVLFALHVFN